MRWRIFLHLANIIGGFFKFLGVNIASKSISLSPHPAKSHSTAFARDWKQTNEDSAKCSIVQQVLRFSDFLVAVYPITVLKMNTVQLERQKSVVSIFTRYEAQLLLARTATGRKPNP
jgi:hypothetical protein